MRKNITLLALCGLLILTGCQKQATNTSAPLGTSETSLDESYVKDPTEEDLVLDEETGLQYVKNQLLISADLNAPRADVEKIIADAGAEVVGYIDVINDYQIEFKEDKTLKELEEIAGQLENYDFISMVTLNYVSEISFD